MKTRNTVDDHISPDNLFDTASLDSLAEGHILSCRSEGKSPRTVAIYGTVLRNFLWYCKKAGVPTRAERITPQHIRAFLWYVGSEEHRWDSTSPAAMRPGNSATVNCYYRSLHSFFNWLEREELLAVNPFGRLKAPKRERKVIRALSPGEVEALFQACSGKDPLDVRNRAIIMVFLDTGLRLSELASLSLNDVDANTGSIIVRNGKGGKQRVVRIGAKAQKALWKYVTIYRSGSSESLFLTRSGEPLDPRGVKMLVKRLGIEAGLRVHPHQLRHTFAISFLRAGGDVFSLQYLLGHSTLAMTQRYLQSLDAGDAFRAHQRFSPLDNMAAR